MSYVYACLCLAQSEIGQMFTLNMANFFINTLSFKIQRFKIQSVYCHIHSDETCSQLGNEIPPLLSTV